MIDLKMSDPLREREMLVRSAAATRSALNALPDSIPSDRIIEMYESLLSALQEPEVRAMPPNLRAWNMQERFPLFANAYSLLFNIACRRDRPIPVHAVREMLNLAERSGSISETERDMQLFGIINAEKRRADSTLL